GREDRTHQRHDQEAAEQAPGRGGTEPQGHAERGPEEGVPGRGGHPPPPGQQIPADGREHDRERSEEHTSELQSRFDLVCRLLLATAPPLPSPPALHDALPISAERTGPTSDTIRRLPSRPQAAAAPSPRVTPSVAPKKACQVEAGIPHHQVSRSQPMVVSMIASSARPSRSGSPAVASARGAIPSSRTAHCAVITSRPMPSSAPRTFNSAAIARAVDSRSVRVAIVVETALEASWKPFTYAITS